jgi:hypothetical protein
MKKKGVKSWSEKGKGVEKGSGLCLGRKGVGSLPDSCSMKSSPAERRGDRCNG